MSFKTLPFEATLRIPPPPVPQAAPAPARSTDSPQGLGKWLADKNLMPNPVALIAAGAGALLILAAVFLFLRRRRKNKHKAQLEPQAAIAAGENLPAVAAKQDAAHPNASLEEKMEARLREEQARREQAAIEVLDSLPLPEFRSKKAEVLVKHITEQARRDPAAIAELFRTWMGETEHP